MQLLALLVVVAATVQVKAAAPEVTGVSPGRGPTAGGTAVLISGTGFTGATQVTFGAANAPSFSVQNDTTILATTPAGAAGLVSVSVTTPEGTSTLAEAFGYGTIPLAVADTFSTAFNTALTVNSPGVLANDDPNNGGGWVAQLGTNVTSGTLNFSADGGFSYTPNAGFVGSDSFTYRSQNATGLSNFAKVTLNVAAPVGPLPPTSLTAAEITGNRVTLRWTPPPFGPAATAYIIEGGLTPGSTASTLVAGTAPIFSFDAPTGSFFVRVRTQAGADISAPSNEIQIFVNVVAVPSAPDNLLALVDGTTLSLVWRNTFNGGAPTSLVLDVSGAAVASLPLGLTDRATFTGVPPGAYTLAVRALNASGSSFPSTPVVVTVPSACAGAPLAATNLTAFVSGSTITVAWDPPASGPAPAQYTLNVGGAFVGSFATVTRGMSGSVGAGTYTLNVVSSNACGASSPTATVTVTVP